MYSGAVSNSIYIGAFDWTNVPMYVARCGLLMYAARARFALSMAGGELRRQQFAESGRETIGDDGPVLTWSHFEATTRTQIIADLDRFRHVVPELVEWMTDVFDRRIVDMHEWARRDYYHSGMRGRTSIKVVLDALWKSDGAMRGQFEAWTGMPADASRDPYASLPAVEIGGTLLEHWRRCVGMA